MKKNILLLLLMCFIATLARAEKTYKKDGDTCKFQGEEITIQVQSRNLITEGPDDSYGEYIQVKHGKAEAPLKTSNELLSRFRLITGENPFCNKQLALKLNNEEIAFFFGKDNRPFGDTLFVLYYNTKTKSLDFMQSKVLTQSAFYSDGKVYFKLASSERTESVGHEMIENVKYNFVEKVFEPWVSFDGKNFRLDRKVSYEKFEHKKFIKLNDMQELSEFRELKYRFATNPKLGKSCLSLNHGNWVCH